MLGWAALTAAFVWIVLIAGGYAGIELGLLRTLSLAIISFGLVTWVLLAWRDPRWRPRTAIWPALVVPYAVLFLTTLTSSLPRLAVDYLAWATLLVALYLLLVRALSFSYVQERIGGLMAMLGLVTSIAYIGVVVGRWLQWWELVGHLTPPMLRPAYAGLIVGGPTVVPVVVVLLMASAFAGLGWSTRGRRIILSVLAVTTLTSVFLSGGRGSWLALAVALVLVGVGILIANRHRLRGLLADRRVRIGLAAAGVIVVVAGLVMAPALLDRLNAGGDGGRAYYVTTAQRMFEDSPVLGQGPGTWPALRIAFTQPGEPDIYVPHPHNTYMLALAETGLVGVAAGVVALLAVLWLVAVAFREGEPVRRRWSAAAAFGLIYLAIASIVDSYANLPIVLLLAALPVATLDATSKRGVTDRLWQAAEGTATRVHALVTVALFVAAGISVVALFRIESAASSHQLAVASIEELDWDAALESAAVAVEADPDMVPYQVTYGLASAASGDWDAAERAFEAAAAADDLPESWMNLALARLELGRPGAAVDEAIDRGRRMSGDNAFVGLAAATLYDRMGRDDEATDELIAIVAANPSLGGDPVWADDPGFAWRWDTVYSGALGQTDQPWRLAMFAGDFERARALADESVSELAPLVVEAWAGDPGALATLVQMALDDPDSEITPWAARASANVGDGETAGRMRQIVTFGLEGASLPGYEARIIGTDHVPPDGALDLLHGYGKNDYRRYTAGHLLAPGFPSLVLVDLADTGELMTEPGPAPDRQELLKPDAIWNSYETDHEVEKGRRRTREFTLPILNRLDARRVLEVGCGSGHATIFLHEQGLDAGGSTRTSETTSQRSTRS